MRFRAIVAVAVLAACSRADAPATDTAATAGDTSALSASPWSGMWDVRVMPEGRDTTLTTYVLNTTDAANWTFSFPNREPIAMRQTGTSGDTVTTEAGPFESALRPGQMVSVTARNWIENGMLRGISTARYQNGGADSVATFRHEGTRRP